ncbi:menaquinone-specific isochorismate synthase [Vibrio ishigakensis]|uniref:Menaquinone-specific isochorismate synthase n=1 Tax=Vibrio ishigakensis TaxID=1481914 RepID=A0A0B8NTP7_9VIBR|nr:menaquinone-specific isochorismate synthase [Vibrio ishigakensis]
MPRGQALEFIEQNEPFSRAWYAGSVGYISETEAEFCVAIRSAWCKGNV